MAPMAENAQHEPHMPCGVGSRRTDSGTPGQVTFRTTVTIYLFFGESRSQNDNNLFDEGDKEVREHCSLTNTPPDNERNWFKTKRFAPNK